MGQGLPKTLVQCGHASFLPSMYAHMSLYGMSFTEAVPYDSQGDVILGSRHAFLLLSHIGAWRAPYKRGEEEQAQDDYDASASASAQRSRARSRPPICQISIYTPHTDSRVPISYNSNDQGRHKDRYNSHTSSHFSSYIPPCL